ncbi:hypothetical protein ACHAXR_012820 [Thalassiosira sp. AJA248-18]
MAMASPKKTVRHIHFNNAGDSPSPPKVTNAIVEHINLEAKVGGYRAAEMANTEKVYESVARLIGAGPSDSDGVGVGLGAEKYNARDEIALVESATVGWTRAFYSMVETKERELLAQTTGNQKETEKLELVILVSEAEYAANLVAAVKFARDHTQSSRFRWRVFPIPSSTITDKQGVSISSGTVDLGALQSMLKGTYAIGDSSGERYIDPTSIVMVCITHIPTNSGIINQVNEIGSMIDNFNCCNEGDQPNDTKLPQIFYLVDACQSVGQIQVNVQDMKCHALAATGRKYLRGPRGTGFLYIQQHIANFLEPSHVDHAAAPIVKVMKQSAWTVGLEDENEFGLCHAYQPGAARFEFWEANVANRLGLGAAIDVSLALGMDTIEKKCVLLGGLLRQGLRAMEGVHVYHDNNSSAGIVTFFVDNLDVTVIKDRMQSGIHEDGFGNTEHSPLCCFHLSVVPATSTALDSSRTGLGESRLLRASLSYFNTEDEIDLFCQGLERLVDVASQSTTQAKADFFEKQLVLCKQIAIDHDNDITNSELQLGSKGQARTRFKEHPRCTARFGEVLLHARDWATSNEEYQYALLNARSIVNYVDACRKSSKTSCPIREGLIADVSAALTAQSIRVFRKKQILDVKDTTRSADFTLEQADQEILGRLYYSAITRNAKYLQEVGLTLDHGGFTALLALCRAASIPHNNMESSLLPKDSVAISSTLSKDGANMDAALSNHFNGITAPGSRFSFSPRHGLDETRHFGRSKTLIVAFSSLGNGLVRHEFGGSLAKLNKQLHADGEDGFDVFFVADPSQSWFVKDSRGYFDGFREYEQRIRVASRPYDRVSFVGDSMGGSASLLFSHLATDSVVAFSPQIDLDGDVHVSRHDMTPTFRDRFAIRLLQSVEEAIHINNRVKIFVHRGVEKADVRHTDSIISQLSGKGVTGFPVTIIEHPDCKHHQIAVHLKEKGQLAEVLSCNLITNQDSS